ncbi:substrate-binding domain-containing protein [Lentisphaera marina]|uniref:substrate-binding domain-containing protein n=1 Tax=Lentisphaera marina TaxID=1111041 RepID=UPI00236514F8|nr:substrate-binding domain-containing protein [Lentisphaera marina]MDD7986548.1 substrate-binding domain-containing protein [Lentisphaera marina]
MLRNKDIIEMLKKRFEKGYYAMSGIPSERDLADELGVARMTARRALTKLVEEGYLNRKSTGRLEFNEKLIVKNKQICFLAPSVSSSDVALWLKDLREAAQELSINICPVFYSSWDDIVFHSALEGFDGLFFIPRSDNVPAWIVKKLKKAKTRLVVLGYDMSNLGFPSLNIFSNIFISQLLDSLLTAGHQKVDCFNVQAHNSTISRRIDHWEFWKKMHGVKGDLIDINGTEAHEGVASRDFISKLIKDGEFKSSALFCLTMPAAIGACRALRDHGIEVGKDVAVCVADGELQAELHCPSISSLERPDMKPYLKICIEWLLDSKSDWNGNLLFEASNVRLHKGESTTP